MVISRHYYPPGKMKFQIHFQEKTWAKNSCMVEPSFNHPSLDNKENTAQMVSVNAWREVGIHSSLV